MVTVTSKPINIEGTIDSAATYDFQLCGYGSQIPRAQGTQNSVGTFVDAALAGVQGASPETTVELIGNDLIAPAGTYYTVTTRNGNGDILQVNAYVFEDGNSYNLDYATPFDPTGPPPPPPPPPITTQLGTVPYSPTPVFDFSQFTALSLLLTGDVTSSTMAGLIRGNLYTFILVQNTTGGWIFNWPTLVQNATEVNPSPNSITIQTFIAWANGGPLLAVAPGTYYP